jgi:hypothetical protein
MKEEETNTDFIHEGGAKDMDHNPDYKSHNNYIMPSTTPYGGNYGGEWGGNSLFAMLIAFGLIDRDGKRTNNYATSEQLGQLATAINTSDSTIKTMLSNQNSNFSEMLQTLQLAGCQQTSSLKDAIHVSSTENLVGQNVVGEKVSSVGYAVQSNAKDTEKTVLVDGALTRKNDDDNSQDLRNGQVNGFYGLDKSICDLSSKISTEHCGLSREILENRYLNSKELCSLKNDLSMQAVSNQNTTIEKLNKIEYQNSLIAKDTILREKDDQIRELQANSLEMQHKALAAQNAAILEKLNNNDCHRNRVDEVNILSKNIGNDIGNVVQTAIANSLSPIHGRLDFLDRAIVNIGNSASFGIGNNTGRHNG